jgi:hypothetical protein
MLQIHSILRPTCAPHSFRVLLHVLTGQIFFSSLTKHYFSFLHATTTQSESTKQAAQQWYAGVQGHMWVPRSFLELEHYNNFMINSNNIQLVWVAISDATVERKWVVTAGPHTGEDYSELVTWQSDEPGGGTGENCASHHPTRHWIADVPCTWSLKAIIEYECPFGQQFNSQGSACIGMTCLDCA